MSNRSLEEVQLEELEEKISKRFGAIRIEALNKSEWSDAAVEFHLTEDFIRKYDDYLDWHIILSKNQLSEDFLLEFKEKVGWRFASLTQNLSFPFIMEHLGRLDLGMLLINPELTLAPMERNEIEKIHRLCALFEFLD